VEVNKLESKEVLVMLFGLPVMITLIVLVSIGVGHVVTTRSDRPTNVTVASAPPRIDVNVPQSQAPQVNVSSSPAKVDVNVPSAPAPTINVTTPPAVVTVVQRNGDEHAETPAAKAAAKPSVKEVVKESPTPAAPLPVKPPEPPQAIKASFIQETKSPAQEDLTLDTLYKYAERYIESYCAKRSLDGAAEAKKWDTKWKQGLEQAMKDNTDNDEQSYINRMVIMKRDCFDLEKATPEKIVEGCRLMLRYRDGQLAWLQAMKDAVTSENMKKTLAFLSAGVK
jgi:hypothetical protein